jgi:hypothetical protein
LKNTEGLGLLNKSDPFFEIQRKAKSTTGTTLWDCVYRSRPVKNDLSPIFDEGCIELSTLCHGKLDEQFRIAMYDFDKNGKHDDMGSFKTSVNEMLQAAENKEPFKLKQAGDEVGELVVMRASTEGIEEEPAPETASEEEEVEVEAEEGEIVISPDEDIEIAPEPLAGGASFVDYVKGGCQLRTIVAIDYTASNGDPRTEDSLHSFIADGHNEYEKAILKICTMLADYDSDKKYHVLGFGAKKDGELDNCFYTTEEEVDGVDGILAAYKGAFKSGIVMSAPTNISPVIMEAGDDADDLLEEAMETGGQVYSILVIFTNGSVESKQETIKALDDIKEDPLSVVVVGVGPGDFSDMGFLNDHEYTHFVEMKKVEDSLSEETLKEIPNDLVKFFAEEGIQPNDPVQPEEIVIEPFSEDDDVQADIVISPDTGDVEVTTEAKPPVVEKIKILGQMSKLEVNKQAKRILCRQKKQFGRVRMNMQRKFDKAIDNQIKQVLPASISNAMGGASGVRRQARKAKARAQGGGQGGARRVRGGIRARRKQKNQGD